MLKDGERSGDRHGYLWVWHSLWAWNSTILIGWCRVKSLIEDMSGTSALYKKSVTLATDFCDSIQTKIMFYSKSSQVVLISWTYYLCISNIKARFTLGVRANVQPKSSIPIGAQVEISAKGLTLGVKVGIEKIFSICPNKRWTLWPCIAPRLKNGYHRI
jgi:hypothetical protein